MNVTTPRKLAQTRLPKGHERLDTILRLNGRELLNHAGDISHEMALEKSALELEKYRNEKKKLSYESSLSELERDIKQIKPDTGNE
ncbi:MAG: virulence RhuM family protein [Deltaproteobacteria bacterium]|nr:virulence RhuM family protein [Deltaproteobacteria bacterium]